MLWRDLDNSLPPAPDVPGLTWSRLQKEGLPELLRADPSLQVRALKARFDSGQICQAGYMSGELVHFRWQAAKDTHLEYLSKTFSLQHGDILDDLAFTRPDCRRLGINGASFLKGLHHARQQGYIRAVTLVAVWNRRVWQASVNRLGFQISGVVGYWNLGLAKLHFCRGDLVLHKKRGFYLPLK